MNYLAHLFLSGKPGPLMVGNFIGDSVKGKNLDHFDPDIARGIRLHRLIDTYTDQHPITAESRIRLRPEFRKYAGVVADIFYDHFLAKHWLRYHPEELGGFAQGIYAFLENQHAVLPYKSQRFFHYMSTNNILESYGEIEGINRVMNGMAKRTSFHSNMEAAAQHLASNYQAYEKEFEQFFPDLMQVVELEGVQLVKINNP